MLFLYGLLVGACYIMIFSECIYQQAIASKNSKLSLSITMATCLMVSNLLMTVFSTQDEIYSHPDTVVGFGVVFGLASVILFGIIAVLWYRKNPNALQNIMGPGANQNQQQQYQPVNQPILQNPDQVPYQTTDFPNNNQGAD